MEYLILLLHTEKKDIFQLHKKEQTLYMSCLHGNKKLQHCLRIYGAFMFKHLFLR
jgi:hypothetical protein